MWKVSIKVISLKGEKYNFIIWWRRQQKAKSIDKIKNGGSNYKQGTVMIKGKNLDSN